MEVGFNDRFWPEGIELGRDAELEFPKGISGTRWWLEGNRYHSAQGDNSPLADVVATTMNILVVQARAADACGLAGRQVSVTVDDVAATAFQLPELEAVVDFDQSDAIRGPEGEPLFWNRLEFIPQRITHDAFWLKEDMPFSYIYMTEAFVTRAKSMGLTGLDYLEPVWDGSACELSYDALKSVGARNGYRYYLETNFLLARAAMFGHLSGDIHPILDEALALGRFPWRYPDR